MDKSEMMQRYEKETGEKPKKKVLVMYSTKRYGWGRERNSFFFTNKFVKWFKDKYDALQAENAQLKNQLTWRPASEKPEKEGRYWVTCLWQEGDEIFYCSFEYDLKKGWVVDKNITVLYWLPIPPAPEGE